MPVEVGGISMGDQLNNIESFTPEVLSPGEARVLIPYNPELAHYNAAVIGNSENQQFIVARRVVIDRVKPGRPDIGVLVLFKKLKGSAGSAEEVGVLDLSELGVSNWEDPRAFTSIEVTTDENGVEGENVLMGLTAIRESDNKPVASTVRGRIVNGVFAIDPESLAVCFNDEGKNTTPFSLDQFLFRRNGFPHTLEVARTVKDPIGQDKIEVIKTISFPKKPWCEGQIGTQAQMLPSGILPIHGTNKIELGINPETKQMVYGYAYSLGLAQLDKNMNVIKVSDNPLFTRSSFKNILPMGKEMDPNKDVIYCCGYYVNENTVTFVINIGDLMTVEVDRKLSELQDMLSASKPILQEELTNEFPQTIAA